MPGVSARVAAMKRVWCAALAFAILSCWLPLAAAQHGAAPPAIDHRKVIAANLAQLFAKDSQVRNVAVSEMRRILSIGLVWAACVRVAATGSTGKPTLPRTYVVTFIRNAVAERRPANDDDCAGAKFEPLG